MKWFLQSESTYCPPLPPSLLGVTLPSDLNHPWTSFSLIQQLDMVHNCKRHMKRIFYNSDEKWKTSDTEKNVAVDSFRVVKNLYRGTNTGIFCHAFSHMWTCTNSGLTEGQKKKVWQCTCSFWFCLWWTWCCESNKKLWSTLSGKYRNLQRKTITLYTQTLWLT